MHLTDVVIGVGNHDVNSHAVPVEVSEDGKFHSTFLGETFEAETLGQLCSHLRDALIAHRVEVPFVSTSGRRGVMRGYHAGNHDILVRWDNGESGRFGTRDQVFRVGEITDEELTEMRSLRSVRDQANERINEIASKTVNAKDVFAEALGEDLDSHTRQRDESVVLA